MSLLGNVTRQGGKILAIAPKNDLLVALKSPNPHLRAICGLLDLDEGIIAFWFANGGALRYRMQVNTEITMEDYHSFAITSNGRRYNFGWRSYSILQLLNNHTSIGVEL